jgi:membrane-associated protease RseP (regulator of RpoE activity)
MQAPDFKKYRQKGNEEDALWVPGDTSTDPSPAAQHPHPDQAQPDERRWPLHVLLFLLTCVTTFLVTGLALTPDGGIRILWSDGLSYSIGLMAILLSHEMGHYIMSVRWGVHATLPYFIPFPDIPWIAQSPFGTLGAVIAMKSPIPNRRALIDIGAAGPLAGFAVTLVVLTVGISLSSIQPLPQGWPPPGYSAYIFGDSLLFRGLAWLILGPVPDGSDIFLHPLARAGWVGMFVTALNLLPIGQLDGGHIAFALYRKHYRKIVSVVTVVLIGMVFVSMVWLLFAVMAVFLGRRHPPPLDDTDPVDRTRRIVGYICIAILVLSFIPVPLEIVTGF